MLSVKVAKLKLENPLILASGVADMTPDLLRRAHKEGAGAVVTKSIGIEPRKGYDNPTIVELPYGLINAMGLPNPGWEAFYEEFKNEEFDFPVIVSIFGKDEREFAFLAEKLSEVADAFELNLSCPHAKGYGMEIGQNPEMVYKVVKAVKDATDKPVIAKLTPNIDDIAKIGLAAEKAGADAVSAINTIKAIAIDIYARKPILSNKFGGYSGPGIKPIALRAVYDLAKALDIDIIGIGGITTWQDALEFLMAGAKALQIGTAVSLRGFSVFKEINEGIGRFLNEEGFNSIDEIIGIALEG
ncbi:MAG: Dihydroorotate dehydrogenase [Thermococcales archaeon 44_46]|jgi:dihydroorotate dehydrogenase (NAD+) catalytic subunit|uniref:dihydroorotate dehydrogenase n=1 Tax=Thermococcus TaxID=2263 RepID=UPI0005B299F3|nr:MAG: Dihydroorotate dehydrogenase [Thermococcales archaeon 44_46]MCA6214853.1 dihydroorotate dehydrogenase [Thermococcus bergensis]MDK2783644.1 dihydroorotate dehydrogenase catalytic subunit [Thermococcaceae archaeon]MDK2853470.1 dihydroorotate dehydrogenase catalytic subunit [Thermococcaceae archaeon]MDK2982882.1 dihydroorotate dehydrogenase catalytic subunit [Thermococcaceae archaeon]